MGTADLDAVRTEARSYFDGVAPSHDWHHVERVYRLAERIGSAEDADMRVVRPAALLHDIGRAKEDAGEIDDHAQWGAEEAASLLAEHGVNEDVIDAGQHCIRAHRYSNDIAPETVEARVLADADNLDALGASGIARTFSYGGEHGSPLADPSLPVEEDDSTAGVTQLNHIQKKILDLQERMHTETAQAIAADRHAFVERFVDRFQQELRGER